jgi:hypothetical protein
MKKNKQQNKKKYYLSCLLVILMSHIGFSQVQQNEHVNLEDYINGEMEVSLYFSEEKEPCFVYENELVEIKIKMSGFGSGLEDLTRVNESLGNKLKNRIESLSLQEYRLTDFESQNERLVMEIIMGQEMRSGFCKIKDKIHNQTIDKIIMKFYDYEPAPLKGEYGAFFAFLSGKIFYKTKSYPKEIYDPPGIEDSVYKTIEISLNQRAIEGPYFYYENSLAEIKVSMDDIQKYITKCKSCERLDRTIKSLHLNEYRLDNFKDKNDQSHIKRILSLLMMEGNCILKEKGNNDKIQKITVDYYDCHGGRLCSEKGKIFRFLSGGIFYKKIDASY